jgi:hypothetical protein
VHRNLGGSSNRSRRHDSFSERGEVARSRSASGCCSTHSCAACRAKRRTRPVSAAEAGLTVFLVLGRTETMSASTWDQGGHPKKWRNRIYFLRRRPLVRRSLIRPAKESDEHWMPSGLPAASKKRMSGPPALPRLGLLDAMEMPGFFPVIRL